MANKGNIKITGHWDGQPIWRELTAEERLAKALEENYNKKYAIRNNLAGTKNNQHRKS